LIPLTPIDSIVSFFLSLSSFFLLLSFLFLSFFHSLSIKMVDAETEKKSGNSTLYALAAGAFFVMTALLANQNGDEAAATPTMTSAESGFDLMITKTTLEVTNVCYKKKIDLSNIDCMLDALDDGSDVTGRRRKCRTSSRIKRHQGIQRFT
jgi:hypothetical protein